jgi:hypothetical protein
MNSVGYAIPENYDTVLNTDNGSIQNVYINSDVIYENHKALIYKRHSFLD